MQKTTKRKTNADRENEAVRAELRSHRAYELFLKGLSYDRIAEALNVSRKTIERDIKSVSEKHVKELRSQVTKFDPGPYWRKQIDQLEIAMKELWVIIAEGKRDRSKAIELLSKMQESLDDRLRRAGVITTQVDPENLSREVLTIRYEGTPPRAPNVPFPHN